MRDNFTTEEHTVSDYVPHLKLTHEGALKMLRTGIAKARRRCSRR
jgi:hypothetical protein